MECYPGRQRVAASGAADPMLRTDGQKGLIPQVSFERLVTKECPLVRGYKYVHSEDDRRGVEDAQNGRTIVCW